jgi:hypothetical protein
MGCKLSIEMYKPNQTRCKAGYSKYSKNDIVIVVKIIMD